MRLCMNGYPQSSVAHGMDFILACCMWRSKDLEKGFVYTAF